MRFLRFPLGWALVPVAMTAAACAYDLAGYEPSSTTSTDTGAGGAAGSGVTTATTTTNVASSSVASASNSSSSGGVDCSDEAPVAACSGQSGSVSSDDFANDDGAWIEAYGAQITGGHVLAHAVGVTEAYVQLNAMGDPPPSFVLHECWIAIAADVSGAGTGKGFIRWAKDQYSQLLFTVDAARKVQLGTSQTFAVPARQYLRVREHAGCIHLDTADATDSAWTEIGSRPSPAWLPTRVTTPAFGIVNPGSTDVANEVVFDDYNLPPLP